MSDASDSDLPTSVIVKSRAVIARSRAARLEARAQQEAARVVVEQVRAMIARSQAGGEAGGRTGPERKP